MVPQQFERKKTTARFVVYFLSACSAALLFSSYRLESSRLETLIHNAASTSRVLPERNHQQDETNSKVGNSEFYVPSLDYRVKGISQYSSDLKANFEAHVYCREFEKDLLWEWWRPNNEDSSEEEGRRALRKKDRSRKTEASVSNSGDTERTTRKRLLIGVSSGYDDSARLLEQAVWSARVYGSLWSGSASSDVGVTVVALQGTAFSPHGCKSPQYHSSIDKVRLLFEAIDSQSRYDRLLLLDADAMVYGMDTDVTSLLDGEDSDDFVVMGSPVWTEDGKREKSMPWKISTGMTLWNLEHPLVNDVALDWFHYSKNAIIRESYRSDQKYLHKALQKYYKTNEDGMVTRTSDRNINIVRVLPDKKFDEDSRGTIVRQFGVRSRKTKNNDDTDSDVALNTHDKQIDLRLARMEQTARQLCGQYADACNRVGSPPRYDTA